MLSFETRHKIAMWLIPVYCACFIGAVIFLNVLLAIAGVLVFCVDFVFGVSQLDSSASSNTEQTKEGKA